MNETLYLEATGPSAPALTPGAVLRALAAGAGIFAEEVLALQPLTARRVAVTLTGARARALSTPLSLVPSGPSGPAWTLRRPEDPPRDGKMLVLATWPEGAPPAPGAVARALHETLGPDVGAEELGVGLVGPGLAQLTLPSRLAALGLPTALALGDGRALGLAPMGPAPTGSVPGPTP